MRTTIHLNADNTYSYAQRWRDASGPQSNICTGKWSYRAATEWVVFDTQCADVIAPTDLEKQRQDGSRYFVAKANKLTRLVDTKQNKGASVYKKTKG